MTIKPKTVLKEQVVTIKCSSCGFSLKKGRITKVKFVNEEPKRAIVCPKCLYHNF